jgi:class 3 adenylate cyclase
LIGFAPNDQPAPVAPPPTEAIGERRHVTVMFCDLVDSTGIAAKLDADRALQRRAVRSRTGDRVANE